jgi:GH24 family phage-related lysozyme (muramidase)
MPLSTIVKTEVNKNIEKYEGRIPHLYLDTVGKVTVGIGHMVPNKVAMSTVAMYKKGANNILVIATAAEKDVEYDAIKKQPFGWNYEATSFKKHTTLIMKDEDINAQRDKHIQSFYKELTGYYTTANGFTKAFDTMPSEVQKALFDMVFNLGITKLKNQYIKFNGFIKSEKWDDAAKQSNRLGISPIRNKYVFDLFKAAHSKQPTP